MLKNIFKIFFPDKNTINSKLSYKEIFHEHKNKYNFDDLNEKDLDFIANSFSLDYKLEVRSTCSLPYETFFTIEPSNIEPVKVEIAVKKIKLINDKVIFLAYTVAHFGTPYFDGSKMIYNYHKNILSFFSDYDELNNIYNDIIDTYRYNKI